jgi:hypothetical protein
MAVTSQESGHPFFPDVKTKNFQNRNVDGES